MNALTSAQHVTPAARRWRVAALTLGVGLILAAPTVALWPTLSHAGICAFVPCAPLVPAIGFTAADDGTPVVQTGPRSAQQVDEVRAVITGATSRDDELVLWSVERTGAVPDDWDGAVTLGRTPTGFTETAPLRAPLPPTTEVEVASDCYLSSDLLPTESLTGNVVLTYGEREPLESFLRRDTGFGECYDESWEPSFVSVGAGVLLALTGTVLVVASRRFR